MNQNTELIEDFKNFIKDANDINHDPDIYWLKIADAETIISALEAVEKIKYTLSLTHLEDWQMIVEIESIL